MKKIITLYYFTKSLTNFNLSILFSNYYEGGGGGGGVRKERGCMK